MLRWRTAGAVAALCALAACSSPAAGPPSPAGTSRAPASSRAPARPAAQTTTDRPAARPAQTAAPAPAPPPPRVTLTSVRTADGALVTVAVFGGPVQYVLHNGSEDPGYAAGRVQAGPAVTGAERQRLLAVFNGGFKLSSGVGGYEQEGRVVSPLRRGLASLVIDRSGQAWVGIWGESTPGPGTAVYSVRQNLPPLVLYGRPTADAYDWGLWGATLGGGEDVARSALGQDAAGDLMYAASMSASPADLAVALARGGAQTAMELDINPEWVQLDVAARPGGPLRAAVPGQNRPSDQYLVGWARDFVAVLGPAPAAPGPASGTAPARAPGGRPLP